MGAARLVAPSVGRTAQAMPARTRAVLGRTARAVAQRARAALGRDPGTDRTYRRRSRHRRRHTHHLAVPAAPGPAARPTCPGPARANWPRTHRTRPLYSVRRRRNSDTAWPSPLSPQVMPTLTCPLEAPFTPQLRRHQPGWVDRQTGYAGSSTGRWPNHYNRMGSIPVDRLCQCANGAGRPARFDPRARTGAVPGDQEWTGEVAYIVRTERRRLYWVWRRVWMTLSMPTTCWARAIHSGCFPRTIPIPACQRAGAVW